MFLTRTRNNYFIRGVVIAPNSPRFRDQSASDLLKLHNANNAAEKRTVGTARSYVEQ